MPARSSVKSNWNNPVWNLCCPLRHRRPLAGGKPNSSPFYSPIIQFNFMAELYGISSHHLKRAEGGGILSKNLVKALQICRTCPILKIVKDWHKSCNKKSNASHPTEIRRIAANAGKLGLIFSVRRELKGLHRSHVQLVSLVHWRRRGAGMQLSAGLQPPETHKSLRLSASLCLSPASINVSENVNH